MRRPARLQAAHKWLAEYTGGNLIRGYARWFGVDRTCALAELQGLGVELDPTQVDAVRSTASRAKHGEPDPRSAGDLPEGYGVDWDEHFSVIAGFTEGGAPFGLTWDEYDPDSPPTPEVQLFAGGLPLSGPDHPANDLLEEIGQFLFRQSNISGNNVRRLASLARHDNPQVRRMASLALAIARVHPRRRRRWRTIRAEHPKLWRRAVAAGIAQEDPEGSGGI